MNPVITQTATSHPALPTLRTMSALTIKIPDPIMEPATSMVPSHNPKTGLNSFSLMPKDKRRVTFQKFYCLTFISMAKLSSTMKNLIFFFVLCILFSCAEKRSDNFQIANISGDYQTPYFEDSTRAEKILKYKSVIDS